MQETIKRHLCYKEELALAAFFSNVEKFRCLADMPLFSKGLLTEPFRTHEADRAPLATISGTYYYIDDHDGGGEEVIDIDKMTDASE